VTELNGMFDHTPESAAAAERVSFQLTYARAESLRRFGPAYLSGDSIPNAYVDDDAEEAEFPETSGEWDHGNAPNFDMETRTEKPLTQGQWIDHYAAMAIAEVVHEGLEWFRVDGAPWLDPHGPAEHEIDELTNEFAARLAELRRRYVNGQHERARSSR
jgi:hypothetical protein